MKKVRLDWVSVVGGLDDRTHLVHQMLMQVSGVTMTEHLQKLVDTVI